MGGDSVRGFLDRVQRRLGTVTRAVWRQEIIATCELMKRQLEQGLVDPAVLFPRIEFLQRRTGTHCNHHFREMEVTDSYTGDKVRECDYCKLILTNVFVPDARCEWCDGPAWREGRDGPVLRFCSAAHRARASENSANLSLLSRT